MTSVIGLSALLADFLVVTALGAAIAIRRASRLARLGIATVAFVCAWFLTVVFDATQAPEWTTFMGGGVIVLSIVEVIATLHVWTLTGAAADPAPRKRGHDDGGGPRREQPDRPQDGGDGSDPDWWPGFERRLASYVAEREERSGGPRPFSLPATRARSPASEHHARI